MASRVKTYSSTTESHRIYDPWDLMARTGTVPDGEIQQAQTKIYEIFINLAKTWESDDVLSLFRQVFIHCVDSSESDLIPALYTLLKAGNEHEFHYTLNRVCYILINNWEASRNQKAILGLMDILATVTDLKSGASHQLRTMRTWLATFLKSKTFNDLQVYTSRYTQSSHWTHRYTSYLLTSQSIDQNNPDEQRLVANAASGEMKRSFKRKLAMYTIQADKPRQTTNAPDNPTLLGEHILPRIKKILAKKGEFSCRNLANIFLAQAKNLKFKQFKHELLAYLVFSMGSEELTVALKKYLSKYLDTVYTHYDERPVDDAILLRTANQVIDFFTLDKRGTPSSIMLLLLSKGYALTLAILLLKVIMISPKSRTYLEGKIGDLVSYYVEQPEAECQWLIQFLEVLNVTFTIYSDQSVNYELVAVPPSAPPQPSTSQANPPQTGKIGKSTEKDMGQHQKTQPISQHRRSNRPEKATASNSSPTASSPQTYRIFSYHLKG